ncbi:MAG: ribosome assembly cofactor RimP [Bacteroidetes bacterium]|nr:ribosome assembly cofactor RimP [Bacteroidota bacterium]
MMITIEKVRKLAEEKIAESTNFIVDISIRPGNNITILLDNEAGVSISDCVAMSRHIESSLDREIDDFELNVMSPGLTEPFKILRQYTKNIGKQVDVLTKENKKLTGKLISVKEEGIVLEIKSKERIEGKKAKQIVINNINLTFNQIKQTKVVISF